MHEFIAKHQEQIVSVLSGFDRLIFRGTLRPIVYAEGLKRYLCVTGVLLKDFGRHVEEVTGPLKEVSVAQARALGRPVRYLPSRQTDKDALAAASWPPAPLVHRRVSPRPNWQTAARRFSARRRPRRGAAGATGEPRRIDIVH